LIPAEGASCWGVAYRLEPEIMDDVLQELDAREQAGYIRRHLQVQGRDGSTFEALTYIASAANSNYLGEDDATSMIEQMGNAIGPSGANVDYLLSLQDCLTEMGVHEPHVEALVEGVKNYLALD